MVWTPGSCHLAAGRVHDHELAGPDLAGAGLDLLDLDDVGVGVELHVVEDAHRRHDEAHLGGERTAQRLDLLGQPVAAVRRIDQRQQRVAELDLEVVDLERGRDRLFGGAAWPRRRLSWQSAAASACGACRSHAGERAGAAAEQQERQSSECRAAAPSPPSRRPTCRAPSDSWTTAAAAPCRRLRQGRLSRPGGRPRSRRSAPAPA